MSKRITILQGHPDRAGGYFIYALAREGWLTRLAVLGNEAS